MEGIQDKDYNFLGNDKFPNLCERLLHERKLKSGYLERRIYEPPLKSEPFIEIIQHSTSDTYYFVLTYENEQFCLSGPFDLNSLVK